MYTTSTLLIVSAAAIVGLVGVIARMRRGRSGDLGSVSAAWTMKHNVGDRGGDRSRGWFAAACSRPPTRHAPADQKVSRSPICPVLVDATLVIWPKLGATTFSSGLLYCAQLNTLNDSKRT